ncbi:MAG: hypothetical protein IT558_02120 [Alphaproteobacteria bacterium]|nr:hypothetical protein [Alphaproteobacteria bacterium]
MKLPEKQVQYIDRPEVVEIFADSVENFSYDGAGLRLEFCVTRFDPPQPPKMPTAKKYTASRLVLSTDGAMDLYNNLQKLVAALEAEGKIKRQMDKPLTKGKVN